MVCIWLKNLVELGDITMDRHQCVFLTAQGRAITASALDKRAMLLELFQQLGGVTPIAMADAYTIEHGISPETYTAFKQLLNERKVGL